MNDQTRAFWVRLAALCGGMVILGMAVSSTIIAGHASQSPQAGSGSAVKTAAQQYKNIQVLKSIPADQLMPAMQFITASLGVECDFCHVEREFDKDDKKEKQTARKMMQMMFAINQNHFEGEREVTCNTCHRGSPHPAAIPAILAENPKHEAMEAMHEHENGAKPAAMPSGEPVLARYLQALGGQTRTRQSLDASGEGHGEHA